jgi:hypothetical protein
MMICFDLEQMRTHFELVEGDLEGMHLVHACICGSNNEVIL